MLLRGDQHVVGGKRDAAARGQAVACLHQLVGEDHRLAQAAATEARIDDARDLLLLERLVDRFERQADRQDLGEERASDVGLVTRDLFDPVAIGVDVGFLDAHAYLGVQIDLS